MPTESAASLNSSPLSVLVVGCGAISELFHLPVLGGHPGFQIAGLVDRNRSQVRKLASQYRVRETYADVSQIPMYRTYDCSLVATPPGVHAAIAIQLLERKIPVLVEKPFALSYAQASQVVEVAQRNQTILSAGYFRRLFPGCIALKNALQSGRYGQPIAFFAQEGCFFDWPSLTMGSMRKESAGGGVLIDTGSHLVDQVLSLFDFGQFEINRFSHDAWGANSIEAQAQIELTTAFQGRSVPGSIRLSRIADWPARIVVQTNEGILVFILGKRDEVDFFPNSVLTAYSNLIEKLVPGNVDAHGALSELIKRLRIGSENSILTSVSDERPVVETIRLAGIGSPDVFSTFWTEWEDFRGAIINRKEPSLSGQSVLPTVRLIDNCYEMAQNNDKRVSVLTPGWMSERLTANNNTFSQDPASSSATQRNNSSKRVLITGATGFIGGRMAEILSQSGYQVRALVHSAGKAGRLMRLASDIEIVEGDLLDKTSLKSAVADCQGVIHCAYGTALERKKALAATVRGTRNLAQVCRQESIERFVYCSTLAVNGTNRVSPLVPSSQITPDPYDYAIAKAKAEKLVQQEIEKGLKGIIFRLGNVYGPFSAPWTIRILRQIASGFPVLYEDGSAPSNTIYVDNVVEAARCALNCSDVAVGQVYVLADRSPTWKEFYQSYANALQRPLESISQAELERLHVLSAKNWLNLIPRSVCSLLKILKGEPLKRLLIQYLTNDPLGTIPRWIFYECPGVRPVCRLILGLNRPDLYFAPVEQSAPKPTAEDVNLFDIYACSAPADDFQTRSQLEYAPVVSLEEGLSRTVAWARDAGLI